MILLEQRNVYNFLAFIYLLYQSCFIFPRSHTLFLNQACAHSQPTAGCGRAPSFLKLLYKKCEYVCMYVCMYVYLFVFPHPREQTFYLKPESSLYTNSKD